MLHNITSSYCISVSFATRCLSANWHVATLSVRMKKKFNGAAMKPQQSQGGGEGRGMDPFLPSSFF